MAAFPGKQEWESKGIEAEKGEKIQRDELLRWPKLHNTMNEMPRFARCLQRSHMERLHLRAVHCREGRVQILSPVVLPTYLLSVLKSTLWGINFLCVQVVLCRPSRQPLGQQEPLACNRTVSTCQLGLCVGTISVRRQWQWLGLNHCRDILNS